MCTEEICIHLRWKLVVAANPRSICDVTDEDLLLPLPTIATIPIPPIIYNLPNPLAGCVLLAA